MCLHESLKETPKKNKAMTKSPYPDLPSIQAKDTAHYLHPFTDSKSLAKQGVRIMTHADGIYVYDAKGQKILDAMSGLWCVNMGYGRKQLAQAAYDQMLELPYYNSFFQTTTIPTVELASKLSTLASLPERSSFSHTFFCSSGSESNDTNIRMIRHYWNTIGYPDRQVIISRKNAYHGSSMGSASLGGMKSMHMQGGLPIPGIVHIDQPYYFENAHIGEDPESFGVRIAKQLEEKIQEIGVNKVAAFIAEPLQGAGGVIIPPSTYWQEIQRIIDKYNILLVSDEVICAFGRLGYWFAYEKFGYKPDLITFAKGVTSGYQPLGGVLVNQKVAEVLVNGGEFNHGYTYSGHPVPCAVALANLELMQTENIVHKINKVLAPYLAKAFHTLQDHPLVGDVETCGMVGALLLVKNKKDGHHKHQSFNKVQEVGMICRQHCFKHGVIMRAVGDRMVICPPLIMTEPQVDEMIYRIRQALDSTFLQIKSQGIYDK
jgi:putrescine aminotransferase